MWHNRRVTSALSTTKTVRDSAIVLRTQDLGEHDRIVILATQHHGLLHAVAKGVRRPSSKVGARLEPFMLVDISAAQGKKLATIAQVVTRRAYLGPIVASYVRFTVATVISEVAEQVLNHETDRVQQQFSLLAGALSSLARGILPPHRVLDSYLLRALHTAGWSMAITYCGSCGEQAVNYFSPEVGALCTACSRAGAFTRLTPLPPQSPAYLAALASGHWDALTPTPSLAFRQRMSGHIMDYVQWQLDRPLKTLTTLEKEN